MKKPDEIKKALECCFMSAQCGECPYYPISCDRELVRDAREYIQQLEAANADLEKGLRAATELLEELQAERDALIDDIRTEGGLCALCKHEDARAWAEPCCRCNALVISGESHWEWRGVQKEE